MNTKLWAAVVTMIMIFTGTGLVLSSNVHTDDKVVVVARVNEEGSGLFVRDIVPDLVTRDSDNKFTGYNPDNWKGLILMTPGNQTIQHMMLMDIVKNDLGLDFVEYNPANYKNNAVNYIFIGPANMANAFNGGIPGLTVHGGIVWESFLSSIAKSTSGTKIAFTTGECDPEHTCCIVAVNRTFAESNSYTVARFLAAYAETVDWMLEAIENPTGRDYQRLVEVCKNYTKITVDDIVRAALSNVKYLYELGTLRTDIAKLVDDFGKLPGVLKYTPQNLGFANSTAFADWLVDEWYLQQSKYVDPDTIQNEVRLRLTVLTGDIHGIAAMVGKDLGIFEKYKINLIVGDVANGPAAMNLLLSGNTEIGFLGAPPTVINSINMYR